MFVISEMRYEELYFNLQCCSKRKVRGLANTPIEKNEHIAHKMF